eukprot:8959183-Pyramimonas_sp.AAC.1
MSSDGNKWTFLVSGAIAGAVVTGTMLYASSLLQVRIGPMIPLLDVQLSSAGFVFYLGLCSFGALSELLLSECQKTLAHFWRYEL